MQEADKPQARIYRPSKSAMTSGKARTKHWVLEFESDEPRFVEPLMGWTGSADTTRQVRLKFESKEQAVAYAQRHGLDYHVLPEHSRRPVIKTYAENFL